MEWCHDRVRETSQNADVANGLTSVAGVTPAGGSAGKFLQAPAHVRSSVIWHAWLASSLTVTCCWALRLTPGSCCLYTPVLIPRPKSGRVVCSTQLHGTQRVCESRWCPVLTSCLARRLKSGTRYGPRCVNSCGRAPHAVVCWSRSCGAWGCDSVYRSQISMKSVSNMLIRGGCLLPWQRQRPRYAPSPRNAWTRDRAHALVSRGVGPAAGCATLVQVPYYRGPSGVDRWCSTREAGQRG